MRILTTIIIAALAALPTVGCRKANAAEPARLAVTEPSRLVTQHQKLDAIRAQLDRIEAALARGPQAPAPTPRPADPTSPAQPTQPAPATPAPGASARVIECAARNPAGDMMWLVTWCMSGQPLTDADRAYLRQINYPGAQPVSVGPGAAVDLEAGEWDAAVPSSYRVFRTAGRGVAQKVYPAINTGPVRLVTADTSGNVATEVTLQVVDTTTGRVAMEPRSISARYGDVTFDVEAGHRYLVTATSELPLAMHVRIGPAR